jgi:hypothetical protein
MLVRLAGGLVEAATVYGVWPSDGRNVAVYLTVSAN